MEEKLSKAKQPIQERVQSNHHKDGQTWKKNGGTEQEERSLFLVFFFLFKVFCLFVCLFVLGLATPCGLWDFSSPTRD